ncbi:MAG: c-type cytochrome biogenesis protein CcmI [Parvularcula sp.]
MAIFVVAGFFVLFALLVLLRPLFTSPKTATASDRESRIYQDQLAELDRDRARGVLSADQEKSARTEIERRLLSALRRQDRNFASESRLGRFALVIGIASVPIFAGVLYLSLGSPEQPDAPFASRDRMADAINTAPGTHAEMRARITALEERLAATPDDLEGQALLARSYASIGDYGAALEAYAAANRLAEGKDVRLAGEYAEVMVLANEGLVPPTATEIFSRILEDFPDDPQATYYIALAESQQGESEQALARLTSLRSNAPSDAPWLPTVDALIAELGGTPPAQGQRRGPTAEQMQAAAAMSDDERAAMISSMVSRLAARLEENPDDVDGWRRLARAYEVLGEPDKAAQAHREVLKRAPNDPAAKAFLNQ